MANVEEYTGTLANESIAPDVLAMLSKDIIEKRFMLPFAYNKDSGTLKIITSRFDDNFMDSEIILALVSKNYPDVRSLEFISCEYNNLSAGLRAHYNENFALGAQQVTQVTNETKVTTEQTKKSEEIIQLGISMGASDIHITPNRNGASVIYRVDGKLINSGMTLSIDDEMMICRIYKTNAKINVNNLIPQDGRFSFVGKNIRLSTMPYGGDGERNKVVLRILSTSDTIPTLTELGFSDEENKLLHTLIYKPSGIILICGPTGEGKTTTLYALINELNNTNEYIITTFEDPVERYIDGVAQSQVRYAEDERTNYTFQRGLRSSLRQDPDIMLVGETRDAETALTAVQASQTGHLIFTTLHVRNSISVFRRLQDMGVNVSGFSEQIVGIASQRLLSTLCPHCKHAEKVPADVLATLRAEDIALLPKDADGDYITYVADGCNECNSTGILGRVPIIEIISFNNFLRDYFAEKHGLIDIELFLRETTGFKSLWDKGFAHVADGTVSLKELLSRIEPDEDLTEEIAKRKAERCMNDLQYFNAEAAHLKDKNGHFRSKNEARRSK